MRHRVGRSIAVVTLLAAVLAACSRPVSDPVVDGWPIGERRDCTARPWECNLLLAAARDRLALRDPGHPEIVQATLHMEGATVDADGNLLIQVRSGGCCSVARFELADGTIRALGVGYPGISDQLQTFDYGP
jgi:hypothetical protein